MKDSDRKALIVGLNKVNPAKPYGTELFDALTRLTVSVAVEAVCLYFNSRTEEIEVFLTKRPQNDTAYPGEWHCPGSVLRPGEKIDDVFSRLEKREFGGQLLSRQFAFNVNCPTEARGHFFSIVYLCVLEKNKGLRGEWFAVNRLPDKTIESHRARIIPAALGAFVAENTFICR